MAEPEPADDAGKGARDWAELNPSDDAGSGARDWWAEPASFRVCGGGRGRDGGPKEKPAVELPAGKLLSMEELDDDFFEDDEAPAG